MRQLVEFYILLSLSRKGSSKKLNLGSMSVDCWSYRDIAFYFFSSRTHLSYLMLSIKYDVLFRANYKNNHLPIPL